MVMGMMFFSASCNVARRYGKNVMAASISVADCQRITVADWLQDRLPNSNSAIGFIIVGELERFDFPVDTLVVVRDPGCEFTVLVSQEIEQLDDGLAFHEPIGPGDREWALFLEDVLDGDTCAPGFG